MAPVDRLADPSGDLRGKRERGELHGRYAPGRTGDDRHHVDPQPVESEQLRKALSPGEHHDGVVAAVGDERDHGNPIAKRQLDEPHASVEVHAVAFGPGAVVVLVASRVDDHGPARGEHHVGVSLAGRHRTHPPGDVGEAGHREVEVEAEGMDRIVDSTLVQPSAEEGPEVGHVDAARVVADHHEGALARNPVEVLHHRVEPPEASVDHREQPAEEVRIAPTQELDGVECHILRHPPGGSVSLWAVAPRRSVTTCGCRVFRRLVLTDPVFVHWASVSPRASICLPEPPRRRRPGPADPRPMSASRSRQGSACCPPRS